MSRSEKSHPEDLDGWQKNAQKLGDEYAKVKDAIKNSGDSHDNLMDALTEATRASPYGAAHVVVVVGSALVAIILALVALG